MNKLKKSLYGALIIGSSLAGFSTACTSTNNSKSENELMFDSSNSKEVVKLKAFYNVDGKKDTIDCILDSNMNKRVSNVNYYTSHRFNKHCESMVRAEVMVGDQLIKLYFKYDVSGVVFWDGSCYGCGTKLLTNIVVNDGRVKCFFSQDDKTYDGVIENDRLVYFDNYKEGDLTHLFTSDLVKKIYDNTFAAYHDDKLYNYAIAEYNLRSLDGKKYIFSNGKRHEFNDAVDTTVLLNQRLEYGQYQYYKMLLDSLFDKKLEQKSNLNKQIEKTNQQKTDELYQKTKSLIDQKTTW